MFGIGKKKEEEKAASCCCSVATAEPQKESCCGTVKTDSACCLDGKMTVKVLGSGCMSCHALLENTQKAVKAMGRENDIQVEYVADFLDKFMEVYNVDEDTKKKLEKAILLSSSNLKVDVTNASVAKKELLYSIANSEIDETTLERLSAILKEPDKKMKL